MCIDAESVSPLCVQGLILQGEKTSFPFTPQAIPSWTSILPTTPSLVSSCSRRWSLISLGTSQSMPGIGSSCTPLRSVWHLTSRLLFAMRPMFIDKRAADPQGASVFSNPIRFSWSSVKLIYELWECMQFTETCYYFWSWQNNELEGSERKPVSSAAMPVENWQLKLEVGSWMPVIPARKLAAEVPAEASGEDMSLAWDGRHSARKWARKQRNIRCWKPLPNSVTED